MIRHYNKWGILFLIFTVTIINYIDRNTIGIMWQDIVADLELVDSSLTEIEYNKQSKELYAYINMFFIVAYGVSQIASGKLYDKIGTRKGFGLSVVIWSIADACTSFATGMKGLVAARTFLGIGVAGPWPGSVKNNAECFNNKQKALAQGIFKSGSCIGAILAPIIIVPLCLQFGWHATFIIVGSMGLIWLIPWFVVARKNKQPFQNGKLTILQLLKNRNSYALILGRFFLDPIWMMFVSWIPIYLHDVYHYDIKSIGMLAWIPYIGAVIGSISGGYTADKLIARGKSVRFARRTSILIGGIAMFPTMIYIGIVNDPFIAVVCMSIVLFGYQFSMTNIQTLASDMYSGNNVGSIAGLGGAAATIGTTIATSFIPLLTTNGNWLPFFIMAALLIPLSTVCVFLFGKDINSQQTSE